ncbi:MAG: hypothetical protein ACR2MR_07590 [Dietzia maris]
MQLMTDVSCGDWLLERVGGWGRIGGVAGTGFEAYARILHPVPATRVDLSITDEWGGHPVLEESRWTWSQAAGRQGLTMHPLVQWNRLADLDYGVDFADGWQFGQTREGYFDLDLLAALTEHLAPATTTPEHLVAGIWNGWGELTGSGRALYAIEGSRLWAWLTRRRLQREAERQQRESLRPEIRLAAEHGPHLEWPGREMILFATSCDELSDPSWAEGAGLGLQPGFPPSISPQLLWPADRSWVVASEIDWDSTIVAGSRSLVDAVLADERLEAFEVDADADLSWEGDLVNPPRAGWSAES